MEEILLGFYYGIGDFISAAPLMSHLAKREKYQILAEIGSLNFLQIPLLDLVTIAFISFNLFSLKRWASQFILLKNSCLGAKGRISV